MKFVWSPKLYAGILGTSGESDAIQVKIEVPRGSAAGIHLGGSPHGPVDLRGDFSELHVTTKRVGASRRRRPDLAATGVLATAQARLTPRGRQPVPTLPHPRVTAHHPFDNHSPETRQGNG